MDRFISPPIWGPRGIGGNSTGSPVIQFWDDFLSPNLGDDATSHSSQWEVAVVDGGTVGADSERHGGWLKIISAASDDHDAVLQMSEEWFLPDATKSFYFETRLESTRASTHGLFVGFTTRDAVLGDAVYTEDHMGFHCKEAASLLASMDVGSVVSSVDTTYDLAANTTVQLGMKYDATARTMKWYVDGELTNTLADADTYFPAQQLTFALKVRNNAGTANTTAIDYVFIEADR